MRLPIRFLILFLLVSLFFAAWIAHAGTSISVTGSWSEAIDKNDLVNGAGSDLQSTYTSISGQISIDISGASGDWRVDIRKVDTNWNDNLHTYVRRTSDGSGGSVSGGTSYKSVTDINTSFFSGSGNVTAINVQLEMRNASIQITPSSYSTVLNYTVVDTQ